MLGSKACILASKTYNKKIDYEECEYDEGGYFIVNGTEKVLVCRERQAENKVYVFENLEIAKQVFPLVRLNLCPIKGFDSREYSS